MSTVTTTTTTTLFTNTINSTTISDVTMDVPINSGKRWTMDEDQRLLKYASIKSYEQLAKDHKRTVSAIRLRLMGKLHGKLDGLNYFSDINVIKNVYVENEDNEISSIIIRYGSPSYEEIRTYHDMEEHHRKCRSNRKLINDRSTEPKLLDTTLTLNSSISYSNRFRSTPIIKEILGASNKQ